TNDPPLPYSPLFRSKFLYTLIISYGLFINPRGLKWVLLWVFKLPIIRKWRPHANESGSELIQTSLEFKKWLFKNWMQAFLATALDRKSTRLNSSHVK